MRLILYCISANLVKSTTSPLSDLLNASTPGLIRSRLNFAEFASYAFLLETKVFPSTKKRHGNSFALLIPILGDASMGTASSLSTT